MNEPDSLWQQLKQLKDELALQAHLMTMELEDEWHALEEKFAGLEKRIEQELLESAEQLGDAGQEHFVGDDEEVSELVGAFSDLKKRQQQK